MSRRDRCEDISRHKGVATKERHMGSSYDHIYDEEGRKLSSHDTGYEDSPDSSYVCILDILHFFSYFDQRAYITYSYSPSAFGYFPFSFSRHLF